jgi:ankyrin repeat protein
LTEVIFSFFCGQASGAKVQSARNALLSAALEHANCNSSQDSQVSGLSCLFALLFPMKELWMSTDEQHGSQGVYGEILPLGVVRMLQEAVPKAVPLGTEDVFYDLGSGLGKMVLQVFLTTPISRANAVELSNRRHQAAVGAWKQVLELGGAGASNFAASQVQEASDLSWVVQQDGFPSSSDASIRFRAADLLKVDFSDGTVVFVNNLLFGNELRAATYLSMVERLLPGTLVLMLKDVPGCHRQLALLHSIGGVQATFSSSAEVLAFVVAPRHLHLDARSFCTTLVEDASMHLLATGSLGKERLAAFAMGQDGQCHVHLATRLIDHNVGGDLESEELCALHDLQASLALPVDSTAAQKLDAHSRLRSIASNGVKTPLHLAASGKFPIEVVEAVAMLRPQDISAKDESGQTPLFSCVDSQKMKILLNHRADVSARDGQGRTALFWAVENGRTVDVLKSLSEVAASVGVDATNAADSRGTVPLLMCQSPQAVDTLIAARARLDVRDSGNRSVMHNIVSGGWSATLLGAIPHEKLREAFALRDSLGKTPLHLARDASMVARLLASGIDIDDTDYEGCTALALAAQQHRSSSVVEELLKHRANSEARCKEGQTALHLSQRPDITLALLQSRAALDARDVSGRTPLHSAASGGHAEVAKALLQTYYGRLLLTSVDSDGRTPLFGCRSPGIAELMLNSGADVNSADSRGRTPLHNLVLFAPDASEDSLSVARLLLGRSQDAVNRADDGGAPPWFHAIRRGHNGLLELLVERRADIQDFADVQHGRTGLHIAAKAGHESMVRLLLQLRVDAARGDGLEMTALDFAASLAVSSLLEIAMAAGANETHRAAPKIIPPEDISDQAQLRFESWQLFCIISVLMAILCCCLRSRWAIRIKAS